MKKSTFNLLARLVIKAVKPKTVPKVAAKKKSVPPKAKSRHTEPNNDDIIKGYRWIAAMDEGTCLECLLRDGKQAKTKTDKEHEGCRCVEVPVVATWKDLGIDDMPDDPPGSRASTIGYIPEDGGLYKIFLIELAKARGSSSFSREQKLSILGKVTMGRPTDSSMVERIKNSLK